MKKGLYGLLRGAGYLAVYLGSQVAVHLAASLAVMLLCLSRWEFSVAVSEMSRIVSSLSVPLTMVSGLLALLMVAVLCRARRRTLSRLLPLRAPGGACLGGGALLGLGLCLLTGTVLALLPVPQAWMNAYESSVSVLSAGHPAVSFIAVTLVSPVVEEVFFRGLVYTRFATGMPRIAAALLASLIFGALHGNLLWTAYTFVLGLVFTWLLERSRSLLPCFLAHMTYNLFGQWAIPLGPVPAAAVGAVCTGAGALLVCRRGTPKSIGRGGQPYG